MNKIISILSLLLLISCINNKSQNIVSEYNGGQITLDEAQTALNKIALNNKNLTGIQFNDLTSEQKQVIVKEAIINEIAISEAKKRKLNKSEEYQKSLRIFENEVLTKKLYSEIAETAVTDAKIRQQYNQLVKELEGKKDVQLSYISVATKANANKIKNILRKYPTAFASQAKKKSLDKESAKNGGDLGFILKDQLQPEIIEALDGLKQNQISQPIQINDKWVIIKYVDERDTQPAEFEQVKELIAESLSQEAIKDFIEQNLADANISIYLNS